MGKLLGLFCEDDKFSLGRIAFWIVLTPAVKVWWNNTILGSDKCADIPENHLYILGFLLIYNSYKKLPALTEFVLAIRGIKKNGQ